MTQTLTTHVVELQADLSVTLPSDIAQAFTPMDRFMVTTYGDTVILKRITSVNVLDRVSELSDDEPPPTMDEIHDIIHEVRRLHHQGLPH